MSAAQGHYRPKSFTEEEDMLELFKNHGVDQAFLTSEAA
jgi:hypothetical protein